VDHRFVEPGEASKTLEATKTPKATETSEPVPIGDANGDAVVTAVDAALTLQFDGGLIGTLPSLSGADANHDGIVNSVDAEVILQMVAGLIG